MDVEIWAPQVNPQTAEDITVATVLSWKKKQGDPVSAGDIVCEVEFGKAVVEVEAKASGSLKIAVEEGQMVPAGGIVGYVQNRS